MDSRYSIISALINAGIIKSFMDIFSYIPKTIVYKDLGVNYARFYKLVQDPSGFTIAELRTLAGFFSIDTKKLIDMACEQTLTVKKRGIQRQTRN